MANYLLVDIGSTYTKLTAVDSNKIDIIATSKHYTTIESDVRIGYYKAKEDLEKKLGYEINFDRILASSSAAGGLKMAAIGLVESLTVEAAKRVCLNAGGKVDLIFSHKLTKAEVAQIKIENIDIILLAGGTDGGNSEVVIHNARMLGLGGVDIPIIYAGNKSCVDEVKEIFAEFSLDGYICANVMPKLNELNIDPAKEIIKKIFLKNIIEAKGISNFSKEINTEILPTPHVVLKAAELLSLGYLDEEGLGESILLDIGGATTDMYSYTRGLPKGINTILHGLEEPYSKRTVEGDLGMRYSAVGIVSALTEEELYKYKKAGFDLILAAKYRKSDVELIPTTKEDELLDLKLAEIAANISMSRHVGTIKTVYTPVGTMYYQVGKDLTSIKSIIGTGGVIVNTKYPELIFEKLKTNLNKPEELRPKEANYYLDNDYIISAMGLLSLEEPLLALKIMKKRIKRIENGIKK